MRSTIRRTQRLAFSLVEVVMALGVFSFCLVSVIYLLGVGLGSSRESARDSALAAALRSVDTELRMLPAATLANTTWNSTNLYYFDGAGNRLTNAVANMVMYRARVTRVPPSAAGNLTGATNSTFHYLWTVSFSYPAPQYPMTNTRTVGRTLYGSGLSTNLYE
ncbi:MAG: Verru_Chthon cassette protein B [Candidatus Methylacidiphilales bacterium]|nr:Verru_Chthon cassette protein B [Candidatus Methylacidiphilales bacterium]